MKPYSKDLRTRVLDTVDGGMPREEVAQVFSVSVPTIKRFISTGAARGANSALG
jgi:transposase